MKKITVTILSILLVLLLTITNLYISISDSLKSDSIKTNIKNNLLTGLIYDDEGNKTEIFKTILRLTTLDEETVVKLMENETASNLLTDLVNSIYDYNLTGDENYKYSREKIISLVEDNLDKVMSEIDYNLSSNDRREVLNYVRNNTDYILNTIYSTDIGGYRP
jgi:hypothetical protein